MLEKFRNALFYFIQVVTLFQQEAHKMVREANVKQAGAEKQLKEAQGKVSHVVVYFHIINKAFCPLYSSISHS